jgi:hypothetical protein
MLQIKRSRSYQISGRGPYIFYILLEYYFTETAVYSAHYQSIMPAVSVTSSTSTNVTNELSYMDSTNIIRSKRRGRE